MTQIRVVRDDITTRQVEAIVNAANSTLLGGGGVDGAIHRAAGPELLKECKSLRGCVVGQAKATGAYGLHPTKYVIHTVGPIFGRDPSQEAGLLASCYTQSLRLAVDLNCRSIAFPSISTGAYGYPVEIAGRVALEAISDFLTLFPNRLDLIEVVTFSHQDLKTYQRIFAKVFGVADAPASL